MPIPRCGESLHLRLLGSLVTDAPALSGTRRTRFFGALRRERVTVSIVAVFVLLITVMVGYNVWGLNRERATPLQVDITGRQRTLAETYVANAWAAADPTLTGSAGGDVSSTILELQRSVSALLDGGKVLSPTGDVGLVELPAVRDSEVRSKLEEQPALIAQLAKRGSRLVRNGRSSPTFAEDLLELQVTGLELRTVAGEATALETSAAQSSVSRLVSIEVVLGVLSAFAAIGMGLLLWRSERRHSARFRSLVHNSSDLITVVDERAIARYQSPSSIQVLGYEPEVVMGKKLTDLLHPNDRSAVVAAFADVYERPGDTVDLTFRLRHHNGTWVKMEGTIRNLIEDKAVGGFVVNTRDVTEREAIAAELAAARDAAIDASRTKSEFLASMSHEIRTPMNAVIGLTGLLLDTNLDTEQHEYAFGVRNAAEGLLDIINGILDFSKIEAGKIELESVDFDIGVLVEDVAAMLGDAAHAKDLELLAHCAPGLPRSLRGDPTRLRQILVNLVSNAVKFTATGEVVLRVNVVANETDTTTLRFEVTDTGIGIAAEDKARMFDPFSQADSSTTRRFGGTGLGLAISKQLIELMGGTLGCDSVVDEGSTFWFEVQFARSVSGADDAVRTPDFEALHALVVDDNATNRLILREQLSSWGMPPDETDNGYDALDVMRAAAARGEAYDVALLDLNMPGMDGLELARTIASEPSIAGARLILLSSSGRVAPEESASAGLRATLSKPVRQSDLYNCLVAALQDGSDDGAPDPPPTPEVASSEPVAVRGHVLLVEDNAMNRLVATRMLAKLHVDVEIAENGLEALDALAAQHFDAVLMDCQMPEMDGYEATGEIRRREATTGEHLPIIAMTAAAMDGDREVCLAAGMDDYITKPIRPEEIDAALTRWLEGAPAVASAGVSSHDA
jgi:two-component system, sensor histidine kinase and response regulator